MHQRLVNRVIQDPSTEGDTEKIERFCIRQNCTAPQDLQDPDLAKMLIKSAYQILGCCSSLCMRQGLGLRPSIAPSLEGPDEGDVFDRMAEPERNKGLQWVRPEKRS